MNHARFANLFPLGSHLCREPMPPMTELKHDMELLKRHGFNLVKLQEHWMYDEPREGACDFSRYEELIAFAATLDLGVYLGFTCEQAPHWLYEKHPDCRMVGRRGQPLAYEAPSTLPNDGKPGPCFDHPGAMADQLRFLAACVATLGRFENVVVWNTWQEIGYWAEGTVGDSVCFCPHTLAAFQQWLAQRYGDLEALNRTWRTRYPQWGAILPNRGARPVTDAVELHWQYFMDNVQVARVLQARAAAIRAADPLGRPIFAHKGHPSFASEQDWAYARTQDFLGSSSYPASACGHAWDDGCQRPFARAQALFTEAADGVAYRLDHLRSANPGQGRAGGAPIWVAELQGGPMSGGHHKGRVPSPEDLRRWLLLSLGAGATGVAFWVTRAEIMAGEQHGYSLLDSTGDSTPRLAEAARIGRALQAHADLFAHPSLPAAKVGILVNEENYQLCTHLTQGSDQLPYGTRGWHRLLWEANVLCDLVSLEYDGDHAQAYSVLILPFPLALSETAATKLAHYVEAGGHLLCEAAPGRIDALGFCPRGEMSPTLAALFGVRQIAFTLVREPGNGNRWSPPERTWGEYLEATMLEGAGPLAGQRLQANGYLQTFACLDGAEPVLYAGEAVAGVRRGVGKGQAWLLGTYVGHNGTAYRDPAIPAAVRSLLAACGVRPEHDGRLIRRQRAVPGKEAWILFNPTAEPLREEFAVPPGCRVADLLGEGSTCGGATLAVTVPPLDVRVLVVDRIDTQQG